MATLAAEMMLPCVLEGSLSLNDMEIERRPYHHNCSCALRKFKGTCPGACDRHGNVSYLRKDPGRIVVSVIVSNCSSQSSSLASSFSVSIRGPCEAALAKQ
ncbi:hypothetical protein BT93_C0199 [Corymbia citriodora subsp. variegata]|nr:hypothetical protein BT93_C0199 [Corymbia citriodora subsp. variegata]